MWIVYAFASAFFAGATAILSKIGIKNINSNLATALRTVVVLLFSWIMVFVAGSQGQIYNVSGRTLVFLMLSGLATGASWLCYFKALQLGDVNKVTPVDKSSTVLTMLLAFIFLNEKITLLKAVCIVLISVGTYMMIEKKDISGSEKKSGSWFLWAVLAAVFAALTSILGKIGISGIESNLGTAIRTVIVMIMAWIVALVTGSYKEMGQLDKKNVIFLILSGIATGCSWLSYYRALHSGPASVVVPVDKLSILVTILFSYVFFKERLNGKSAVGLCLIVAGTLLLLV